VRPVCLPGCLGREELVHGFGSGGHDRPQSAPRHRSAQILTAGHAFVQNLRRGHYEIATDVPGHHRLRIAFDDLATTI
jgi:hypothetical protein